MFNYINYLNSQQCGKRGKGQGILASTPTDKRVERYFIEKIRDRK